MPRESCWGYQTKFNEEEEYEKQGCEIWDYCNIAATSVLLRFASCIGNIKFIRPRGRTFIVFYARLVGTMVVCDFGFDVGVVLGVCYTRLSLRL